MTLAELLEASRHLHVNAVHKRKHMTIVSVAIFLLLAAFVLLFFVSISLPIFKAIYLLGVQATTVDELVPTNAATELRFGVWGYCATGELNQPTVFVNNGECSKPRLGYVVDNSILSLVGDAQILQIVLEGLTFILILHPICAGLACVAATISLFSHIHGFAILTLVLSITTALLTSVSCAVDIAIVAVAMNKVKTLSQFDFKVLWGNAPWMSLVAAVLIWIVVVLFSAVLCGCCGVSRDYWMRYDQPLENENKQEKK